MQAITKLMFISDNLKPKAEKHSLWLLKTLFDIHDLNYFQKNYIVISGCSPN